MDHDNTDFQSQNIQLAGEDNSKFPSGLRSFALPKLDIDDQLQSHLRFDNLIDSEGFFSVQGHDNSWIEVLSTESSVVDFSSSAAESCSISRTNNVWSEATSTESVEMLLKSVGENEMSGKMDGNAHHQLSGTDDLANMQPNSSKSPTGSIVVPTGNDQPQSTRSRTMEDPSRMQHQIEHIAPFSINEKDEHAVLSTLSDGKSNYMLEHGVEKCIVSEKLPSASKNSSESSPAVGSYFAVIHDGGSLDKHKLHLAGVDSGPFSELASLQNVYTRGSYGFEQDNQESGVGVTSHDSEICHMNENEVQGGLHELQNLSCPSQPLGAKNISDEVSNDSLLSGSSDGLLEAITNPVKMLQMNDGTFQGVNAKLQQSFCRVEQAAEGLKNLVDRSSEPVIKEIDTAEEPGSPKFHQPKLDSRNYNTHCATSLSTESGELAQSPKAEQLAHATEVSDEIKSAAVDDTEISTGDGLKLGVFEQHQSADNLKSCAMEEKTIMEEISAVSDTTEHMMESGQDENVTSASNTSKDKVDSSGNIVLNNSSACLLDEKNTKNSLVIQESFKEDAIPALEAETGNQHLLSPYTGPQEEKSIASNISGSNFTSTNVVDTFDVSKDKDESSGVVAPNDSVAGSFDENGLKVSSIYHEGPIKEGAKSVLEVGGQNVTSPVSEPQEKAAVSVNSNINDVCCTVTDAVATKLECKEQDISVDSLTTNETQNKSDSGDRPDAHPQTCHTEGHSTQSEHHNDLVTVSSDLNVSPCNDAHKIVEASQNSKDDLNSHLQDKVSQPDGDDAPGTVLSQTSVGLEHGNGDGRSSDPTCGSPTVISCTEPCPPEDGHGGNALLRHTLTEQSEVPKHPAASADAGNTSQISQDYSAKDTKPTIASSEGTNKTGSFSFEVGTSPNVSEKAHSPTWSPFFRSEDAQNAEATAGLSINTNLSGSPPKNKSDDNRKMSIVETGKEQQQGKEVIGSAGFPSTGLQIDDCTKSKSAPLEKLQQPPTPESPALAHQPFTDLQHVQLRAQIFVYGALIQGIPPAEAYMVSAFGEHVGGGKAGWEAVLRAAIERFQNQKSPLIGLETPTSSRLGSCMAEKGSKGTAIKIAPASKKGGKNVLPAQSTAPLLSPIFNMSPLGTSTLNLQRGTHLDFSQAVSPVFTYNSQMRQPTSAVASWFSQSPGTRPAPWLIPQQNLIFDSSMQSTMPTKESTKGSSSKNVSISQAGGLLPSQAPSTVSLPLTVAHDEKQKAPASSSKRGGISQKPRKRKKVSASLEQQTDAASPQLATDVESVTPATKHTPGFLVSSSPSNVFSSLGPNTDLVTSVPKHQTTGSKDAEQRFILSEQIAGAIDQSTAQAKGASMHYMETLRNNEGVWSHLSTHSRSKLSTEIEQKLISAAVAASAAVSVAKAAAEAARLASEATLQAKMMLDEALGAGEFVVDNSLASVSNLTPSSSWKMKDNSHAPASIISVAREAARKRVEEASAAAKRAENLDAILKAAELAAESVFKVGTIIGMGEPLPFTLSELLEAGPDGYWKSDQVGNKKVENNNDNLIKEQLETPADFSKSGRNLGSEAKYDQVVHNSEPFSMGKELQPVGTQSGNGVENVPTTAPLDGTRNDMPPNIIWNGIGKGSPVEVLAAEGGFGVAWFSAKVLDINEDSAYVSYDTCSEGTGLPTEWVPLKQEGEKAPRIRLSHPATFLKSKGTRKRRRDTAGHYSWTIGDHVDAWIKDSWREGIISQNCDADDTKFSVTISGGGSGSLIVDAWNLRPSLVWKDGQWVEWSRVRARKTKSNKGDSPYDKRQRTTGSDALSIGGEAGGPSKDESTNKSTKPEDPKPLALSDKELIFSFGQNVSEKKTDGLTFKRPGLQKEGSRVVGVPKHGKKKKFMEVSKHYDAGQADKISDSNVPIRPVKHLMPQVPRPPRESTLKVDQRGKRIGEMRSRGLKSTRSQNAMSSNVPGKDPLSRSVPSSGVLESSLAFAGNTGSSSNTVNPTPEKNDPAQGTTIRTEDASVSESHTQAVSTASTSKKKLTTIDRANKRKYVPSMENLNRNIPKTSEISGKTSSDSSEPRRSNRRIQPTSRLLEGLQSSLIVSKVPGEKGPRTNYRSASSRGRAHL